VNITNNKDIRDELLSMMLCEMIKHDTKMKMEEMARIAREKILKNDEDRQIV